VAIPSLGKYNIDCVSPTWGFPLVRAAKAQDRLLKREYLKEKRSLASRYSERMRSIKRQQAESEAALREKRGSLDRELEQKRWEILMGRSSS